MRQHEHQCFLERSGLQAEQVTCHDLTEGPPTASEVTAFDALLIGGSGDFYVSRRNLPDFERFIGLLGALVDRGHPTFGSCFGYQCLVEALGGEVVHDPTSAEVGTYELRLTEEGRRDPLFSTLPSVFRAQMGHKDRARRHPDGLPNLAASDLSPMQALRVPDQPIWATQFHPELTEETNVHRYLHYLDGYAPDLTEAERAERISRFEASPEASSLLRLFLDLVFR